MAKSVLMDQFHVTAFVPRGLRREEYRAIRRALAGRSFRTSFNQAVKKIFERYPSLRQVRVTITS